MATLFRFLFLAAAVATFSPGLCAGEPSSPRTLTTGTYEELKNRIDLSREDLAWQQVRWRDGFLDGLLAAQAADKPLFFWFYGGDARGNC
jgi:hypothetical protein